jgi:alpha,alpha-trehalase
MFWHTRFMPEADLLTLPHALEHLDHITEEIDGAQLAVFLDYDGTLTPIVDDPAEARLSDAGRAAIARLARLVPVAIISGRDLDDVASLVDIDGLVVAGSHGFDIRGPGWEHQHPSGAEAEGLISTAVSELQVELGDVPGVLIEHKRFAVAVHTRRVDESFHEMIAGHVARIAADHPQLRITGGKMIHELRPAVEWDKGRAVQFVADELHLAGSDVCLLYLGDDETDEDALGALGADGIGIVVGDEDRPTRARYQLSGPGEVVQLLNGLADIVESRRFSDPWRLVSEGYDPDGEGQREALCTLGNGYVATRGALAECRADGVHYPGTYFAGVFNRLTSTVADRQIVNEDMVNAPNWLLLTWRPVDGEWLDLGRVEVLEHRHELDLLTGVATRTSRVRDAAGRTTSHIERRFVSMDDRHLAAIELTLIAEDWSGSIEVRSGLDGSVENLGVERYRDLASRHLETTQLVDCGDAVVLGSRTTSSDISLVQASRTLLRSDDPGASTDRRRCVVDADSIAEHLDVALRVGEPVVIDKIVALHTSRDHVVSELADDAHRRVRSVTDFEAVLEPHRLAWRHIWNRFDVAVDVAPSVELALNLHIFHLAQVVSKHFAEIDAGIPARGLHGEAYRGHIFWDELFIVPYLALRLPGLARGHLMYRYRRLAEARRAARDAGYRGAMFPWQSGSTGREETQVVHLNPQSGRWLPDGSHLQRHINAAVVYDIWQYHEATGDTDFMAFHGAEMVLDIALFWSSIAEFDHDLQRYRIRSVMGPDEYHERLGDASEPGLDDNAYTNVMAVWCVERAMRLLDELSERRIAELRERLGITDADIERWVDMTRRMRVCFHDGVISQFDGYQTLAEFDWEHYRNRYGDISRLDRILEAEGDSTNRYRLSKQADVLMLFYLFTAEELEGIFERLGYQFDPAMIPATIDYYRQRTSHGSTLSRVVEAWVQARRDRPGSWSTFLAALRSDLFDIQGGTTAEGIHLGAMAGTLDLIQRCYTGIAVRDGVLWLNPLLPPELGHMSLDVRFQKYWVHLEFTRDSVEVSVADRPHGSVAIGYRGETHRVDSGSSVRLGS